MPEYKAPGLYVEEIEGSIPRMEGVASAVCLFIGPTSAAHVSSESEYHATAVTSIVEFEERFGRPEDIQTATGSRCNYVDRTTMTQGDIEAGRLIVLIGIAPIKSAEFVILRIALSPPNS